MSAIDSNANNNNTLEVDTQSKTGLAGNGSVSSGGSTHTGNSTPSTDAEAARALLQARA